MSNGHCATSQQSLVSLPLQFSLKCEGVLSALAHIQNALGQSDGAVVRLIQFVNYEEQVWAQCGHDELAPDQSRQVHQHRHGQKRVREHLDGRWEKRVTERRFRWRERKDKVAGELQEPDESHKWWLHIPVWQMNNHKSWTTFLCVAGL